LRRKTCRSCRKNSRLLRSRMLKKSASERRSLFGLFGLSSFLVERN